jgi:D-alanyl-D-alanine carboxypeptidase
MNQISRRRSLETLAVVGLSTLFPSLAEARPHRRHQGQDGPRPSRPPLADNKRPPMGWAVIDEGGNPVPGLAENENVPGAIASLTKVWTAAVLFDEMKKPGSTINLQTVFTMSADAARVPWSTSAGVFRPGDSRPLEQWLPILGCLSHNGVAHMIAENVEGNVGNFVAMMNARVAASPGMDPKVTHFADPHGLSEQNKSTALEAAKMLRAAVLPHEELFRMFFGLQGLGSVKDNGAYEKPNHYGAIGQADIDIGKSGYFKATGRNAAFSASKGGHRIYGVVLHAPNGPPSDLNAVREAKTVDLARHAFGILKV